MALRLQSLVMFLSSLLAVLAFAVGLILYVLTLYDFLCLSLDEKEIRIFVLLIKSFS